MPDYIPKADREAEAAMRRTVAWLGNNGEALGLDVPTREGLFERLNVFTDRLNVVDVAKGTLQTRVNEKDTARSNLETEFRRVIQTLQLNPLLTDAMRAESGIPIRDTVRTTSSPVAPRDLVAVADAAGFNSLTWSAAGNAAGVRYVVEAKPAGAAEFSTVDVVTATKFKHGGQTPGRNVVYRVLARRGDVVSPPSNTASVY